MATANGPTTRRGSTTNGLLVACSVIGTFIVTAAIVTPLSLHASDDKDGPQVIAARQEHHQQVIEAIATLLGRSEEIVAVHDRGESPFVEVVLRLQDKGGSELAEDEIAVLSHSEVLQTITFYTLPEQAAPDPERRQVFADAGRRREQLTKPRFCTLWRSDPGVVPRVIATGVTDMTIEQVERLSPDRVRLWIELTWGPNSSDGEDSASVFVHAVMRE